MGMLWVSAITLLLATEGIMTSYASCEFGTCKETRDMDLEGEERISDRYLRRSNEILAHFSKDMSAPSLPKRSEGSVLDVGARIRSLEDIYRELKNNPQNSDLNVEKEEDEAQLCEELGLNTPTSDECVADEVQKYRSIDGSCNNLFNPQWGKASYPLLRITKSYYSDDISEPYHSGKSNTPLPTARNVSVAVTGNEESYGSYGATELMMHFGQFIDHDLVHVPSENADCGSCVQNDICFPIGVPPNDPVFSQLKCLEFHRSRPMLAADCLVGPRTHVNQITSYLDSSNVYGSELEEAEGLRDHSKGAGQMLVDDEPINEQHLPVLPPDQENTACTVGANEEECGKGGDVRAAEQPGLTGLHTILVRQHNTIANKLEQFNNWDDDRIYQETKKIINALYQHIVYNEFLPTLLGYRLMEEYGLSVRQGSQYYYDGMHDATAIQTFAAAAFRFGHTMVPESLRRVNSQYVEVYPSIPLKEAFFNATHVYDFDNGGVDAIMLGMIDKEMLKFDLQFSSSITQFLFLESGKSFGMDLISLNVQRGRDHGLSSYTDIFQACFDTEIQQFSELRYTSEDMIRKLESVYGDVKDIDAFIGMLSEEPIGGATVGPTAGCVIAHHFHNIKFGDRFWYENQDGPQSFSNGQLNTIRDFTYARLLCNNIATMDTIQPYAFRMPFSSTWGRRYRSFAEFSRKEQYPLDDGTLPYFRNERVPCSDVVAIPKLNLNLWRRRN